MVNHWPYSLEHHKRRAVAAKVEKRLPGVDDELHARVDLFLHHRLHTPTLRRCGCNLNGQQGSVETLSLGAPGAWRRSVLRRKLATFPGWSLARRTKDPMRADQLLVKRGLAPSRTAAQRLILAGRVRCEIIRATGRVWETVTKASLDLAEDTPLEVLPDDADRYVSRGGLKLAGALAHAGLEVGGWVCLDVGQSTGGFTDCLLQAGAARVVGVDVGHGQLHPRLRSEPRVVCLEGINVRRLTPADLGAHFLPEGFDLIVADVSFISLTLLLPRFPALLRAGGIVLALIKPQFEVGPAGVGKRGLVRDPRLYAAVEAKIRSACTAAGLTVIDWFDSPITGGDGNREFFMLARRN